ncbi:PTS beta-glucoside transporter subunit EIIBCA [Dellaglioa algida]|nr:PTS beta-glucoside transporter subunit EIIBCA [Dellaglioa algida]
MSYDKLAKDILKNVGGEANVNSVVHCTTRLRFKLKDEDKANTDILKDMDGVVTVVKSGGQYQVVVGNQVPEVYDELVKGSGLAGDGIVPDDDGEKMKPLDAFIDMISGIFAPTLGVLAATGMIKGLVAMLVAFNWVAATSGTYIILNALGDSFFYFFPIILAYSASKKFHVNPLLAMVIGASLVYPTIVAQLPATLAATGGKALYTLFAGTIFESPIYMTFLGIPVIMMSYASSVVPIIVSIWFASKVEPFFQKRIPEVVRTFLVPMLTALVVVPITFIFIGPLTTWASDIVATGFSAVYSLSPIAAGAVLGGLWQVLVIFGLHWGLIPLALLNISTQGSDPILALMLGTTFAQIGSVLAITIKTKNNKLKALGYSSFISGIFGVTEPAIYGITLPRKKPFVITCISAAIGGMILGLFGTKGYLLGGLGIFSIPSYLNPKTGIDMSFYAVPIAIVVSFVLSYVLTMMFGLTKADQEVPVVVETTNATTTASVPAKSEQVEEEVLVSPLKGQVLPLADVKDPVFNSGAMGNGIAILPEIGQLYAPADGVISLVFPTGHAVGMKTDSGAEILMHIGMDTVELGGKFFEIQTEMDKVVKKGDLLLKFDIDEIKKAGYEIITPIIVTNTPRYKEVNAIAKEQSNVIVGDDLLDLETNLGGK